MAQNNFGANQRLRARIMLELSPELMLKLTILAAEASRSRLRPVSRSEIMRDLILNAHTQQRVERASEIALDDDPSNPMG